MGDSEYLKKTDDLLGWQKKKKIQYAQFCGRKSPIDKKRPTEMAEYVQVNGKLTVVQITTLYNEGIQKGISESTTRLT